MTSPDDAPPQNIPAEQAVLGACMVSAQALRDALEILSDDDWYRPAHAELWQTMRGLAERGEPVDPMSVQSALTPDQLRRCGGATYLHTLYAAVTVAAAVGHHARIVAEEGLRRRLIVAAERAVQAARTMPADDAAEYAVTEMTLARNTQMTAEASDVDVNELVGLSFTDEWVIPGLLARGDRFILTADSGLGKSTLLRQIAVTAACGSHPFRPEPIDPLRVLVVDCENGRKLSRDRYRVLLNHAEAEGLTVEDRLRIDIRPQGLNLLHGPDASMLLRMVERTRPDLLLIGPIYRLHEDDPNDERTARKVAGVLDRARAVSGCAVVTEAHTPHTDGANTNMMRPVGSSLWKRWPEFGYCLRLVKDSDWRARQCALAPWRGPRDERDWPEGLVAGQPGDWPWVPLSPSVMRWAS